MACLFLFYGAESGTRTRTDCSTRPSNVRGYQLRHLSEVISNPQILKPYFKFVISDLKFKISNYCLLAGTSEFAGTPSAGSDVFELASAGAAMFEFELAEDAVFELASAVVVSVEAGASAGVSGLPVKTETFPVSAGIASNNADNINIVAALIVTFERTVAVPRGLIAELDTLLVNKAPASVLPG